MPHESPLRPPTSDDPRAEIAEAYDRWAGSYDDDPNRTRDLDARVLRASGLAVDGRDVLEIGCGTAKNTRWLAARARRVVGMDFSRGMLEVARARIASDNVELIEHDVQRPWPMEDAQFDFVIADLILEHIRNLTPVFSEARRVLRPGGALFLPELHPFRQLRGGQAHFTDASSGEMVFAPAYVHAISEYVNAGIEAGLVLLRIDECRDLEAADAIPRLLVMRFAKPGSARSP